MKTLHLSIIIASVFFILFLTSYVYAQCTTVNGKPTCIGMEPYLISIKSDMLVYVNSDKPVITITGVPNKLEYLEINNHSGNIMFSHSIELPPTGVVNYTLDISSYKPDIYSANVNTSTDKATTSFAVGLKPSGNGIVLISSKPTYIPSEIIQITGFWNPNTMINIDLVDPTSQIKKSTLVQSDSVGNFTKKFVVPNDAINGTWQVRATSGFAHTTLNIFVFSQNLQQNQPIQNVHVIEKNMTLSRHPAHVFSMLDSPLKQFNSGIKAQDVKCKEGLQLVFEAEDGSPACVKPDTAQKLIERGWTISTTDLKPWVKIDTPSLNNTYVVNQPISFSVAVKEFGNYPCVSPQIKIHDNKNPNVPVFQDNGSTMSCPALKTDDNYSFNFPGSDSRYVIILNKTGDYTMTISYGDTFVQKYFSIVLPSNQASMTILENNVGVVSLKNQTYYFETPNYTSDAYIHPVQISFHEVVFTLFPSGFRGRLPTSCGETYYWTDAKFSDNTSELLHIFAGPHCPVPPLPISFSKHTTPQAGLTFCDGKMKLLTSVENK